MLLAARSGDDGATLGAELATSHVGPACLFRHLAALPLLGLFAALTLLAAKIITKTVRNITKLRLLACPRPIQ